MYNLQVILYLKETHTKNVCNKIIEKYMPDKCKGWAKIDLQL